MGGVGLAFKTATWDVRGEAPVTKESEEVKERAGTGEACRCHHHHSQGWRGKGQKGSTKAWSEGHPGGARATADLPRGSWSHEQKPPPPGWPPGRGDRGHAPAPRFLSHPVSFQHLPLANATWQRKLFNRSSQGQHPCNTGEAGGWEVYLRMKRQRMVQKLARVSFLFPPPSCEARGHTQALPCPGTSGEGGTACTARWPALSCAS